MQRAVFLAGLLFGLGVSAAMAQEINLTGRYECVNCPPGQAQLGFITQGDGRDLNLVNERGQSSRGYIEYPGRIWTFDWNEAAIVSPDGMTIQFDRGSVWRRVLR